MHGMNNNSKLFELFLFSNVLRDVKIRVLKYHKYKTLFHFIFTVHLFIIELFVPTNALRQLFHCFLYYYDAPIRISLKIPPDDGRITAEMRIGAS
jgi:hypothetical protein